MGPVESLPAPLGHTSIDVADTFDWRRLAPAAATVRAIAGAIAGTILATIASAAVLTAIKTTLFLGLTTAVCGALSGGVLGAWVGYQRWRRTEWRLDAIGLHVRRGLIWRVEVLVPRSRVQHLDVERGPLERQFNLATFVVHTAGTQTAALRLSGLLDPDAVALRDALIPDATRHVDAL
jgi:membrane protein YdbS with pleckstrin-like domain